MTFLVPRPFYMLVLPLFILVLLGGCSSTPEQRTATTIEYGRVPSSEVFPVPPEIQGNVDFWRNVYAKWGRGQVAIHDDEYLDVVYEVVNLLGTNPDGYTPDQQALIRGHVSSWQGRLRSMQDKVAHGGALSPDEAALRDRLVASGGTRAIYGADERVRPQRGLRERFRRGVEVSGRYEDRFREVFRSAGLPEDLAFLPHVESSYQLNARSTAGATGVWQFMPATGRSYMHVGSAVDERLDPVVSAKAAARYLGEAHSRLGTWPLAITSYNHGVGGMARAKSEHGTNFGRIVRQYQGPAFKFASRNYYAEFLAAREIASHPDKYYPGIVLQPPMTEERIVLQTSTPASQVAGRYGVSLDRLAAVNLAWLASARSGQATLPAGHTVWLPAGSAKSVAGQPSGASPTIIETFDAPVRPRRPSSLVLVDPDEFPVQTLTKTAVTPPTAPPVAPVQPAKPAIPAPAMLAKADRRIAPALPAIDDEAFDAALARIEQTEKAGTGTEHMSGVAEDQKTGKAGSAKVDKASMAKNEKSGKAGSVKDDKAVAAKNEKNGKTGPTKDDKAALAKNEKSGKAGSVKGDKAVAAKNEKNGKAGPTKDDKAALAKIGKPGSAKDDKKALAKVEKTDRGGKAGAAAKEDQSGKTAKAATKASREHVVQANETLFRVAARYDLSVEQLRRMNGVSGKDNSIRPGQRLRVSM
jgi:membrane-bound lytic murein transglycosylase D